MKLTNHFNPANLPESIRFYLDRSRVYDTGSASRFRTYFVEGDRPLYLKMGGRNALKQEQAILHFLKGQKLAASVVAYEQSGGMDYLLTTALPGENASSPLYMNSPKRLAALTGECLHRLHSIPTSGCPYTGLSTQMLQTAKDTRPSGEESPLWQRIELLGDLIRDDSLIHGSFSLSNLLLSNFALSGFTGLSQAGGGDRHYDLYRAVKAFDSQFGDGKYTDVLLDAYGREFIDPARLECFRLLAERKL